MAKFNDTNFDDSKLKRGSILYSSKISPVVEGEYALFNAYNMSWEGYKFGDSNEITYTGQVIAEIDKKATTTSLENLEDTVNSLKGTVDSLQTKSADYYEQRWRTAGKDETVNAPEKTDLTVDVDDATWHLTPQYERGKHTWMTARKVVYVLNDSAYFKQYYDEPWSTPMKITGDDGSVAYPVHQVLLYKWTDSRDVPIIDSDSPEMPEGWQESPGNAAPNTYLWMIQGQRQNSNYIKWDADGDSGTEMTYWSSPICLSGSDGKPGKDGTDVEFIYKRFTSEQLFTDNNNPSNWDVDQNDDYRGPAGYTWNNNPEGVSSSYPYEYSSIRYKTDSKWGKFTQPFLWSKYGEDGVDGDGVEYIFYRSSDENEVTFVQENLPPTFNLDSFQKSEVLENNWTDDPQGVNENNVWEYVSVRKFKEITDSNLNDIPESFRAQVNIGDKIWFPYSKPVLWSKYAFDAVASNLTIEADNDVMAVAIDGQNTTRNASSNSAQILLYHNLSLLSSDKYNVSIVSSNCEQSWLTILNTDNKWSVIIDIPENVSLPDDGSFNFQIMATVSDDTSIPEEIRGAERLYTFKVIGLSLSTIYQLKTDKLVIHRDSHNNLENVNVTMFNISNINDAFTTGNSLPENFYIFAKPIYVLKNNNISIALMYDDDTYGNRQFIKNTDSFDIKLYESKDIIKKDIINNADITIAILTSVEFNLVYTSDANDKQRIIDSFSSSDKGGKLITNGILVDRETVSVISDGANGNPGTDSKSQEYIYFLCDEFNKTFTGDENPAIWISNKENYQTDDYPFIGTDGENILYNGWTDHPQGISETQRYEYISTRTYDTSTKTWGAFSEPVIWANWGHSGEDGDGVEYIYAVGNNADWKTSIGWSDGTPEAIYKDPRRWIWNKYPDTDINVVTWNNNYQSTQEYRGNATVWKDNPVTNLQQGQYQFVTIRKYKKLTEKYINSLTADDLGIFSDTDTSLDTIKAKFIEHKDEYVWLPYSEPTIWGSNIKGADGEDAYVLDWTNDQINLAVDENGKIKPNQTKSTTLTTNSDNIKISSVNATLPSSFTYTGNVIDGKYNISFTFASDYNDNYKIPENGVEVTFTVELNNGKTLTKVLKICGQHIPSDGVDGQNAVTYEILTSANSATRNTANVISPSAVTLSALKYSGTNITTLTALPEYLKFTYVFGNDSNISKEYDVDNTYTFNLISTLSTDDSQEVVKPGSPNGSVGNESEISGEETDNSVITNEISGTAEQSGVQETGLTPGIGGGVEGGDVVVPGVISFKVSYTNVYLSYLYNKVWKHIDVETIPIIDHGEKGAQGFTGPAVRYCGEWKASNNGGPSKYYNGLVKADATSVPNVYYKDIVYYNGHYYTPKESSTYDKTGDFTNIGYILNDSSWKSSNWIEATQFDFVATKLLYADQSLINQISTHDLIATNQNGYPVAGVTSGSKMYDKNNTEITSYLSTLGTVQYSENAENDSANVRIFAGEIWNGTSYSLTYAPFNVRQDGTAYISKANIIGDVNIGGNVYISGTNVKVAGDISAKSLALSINNTFFYNTPTILPSFNENENRVIYAMYYNSSDDNRVIIPIESYLWMATTNGIDRTDNAGDNYIVDDKALYTFYSGYGNHPTRETGNCKYWIMTKSELVIKPEQSGETIVIPPSITYNLSAEQLSQISISRIEIEKTGSSGDSWNTQIAKISLEGFINASIPDSITRAFGKETTQNHTFTNTKEIYVGITIPDSVKEISRVEGFTEQELSVKLINSSTKYDGNSAPAFGSNYITIGTTDAADSGAAGCFHFKYNDYDAINNIDELRRQLRNDLTINYISIIYKS